MLLCCSPTGARAWRCELESKLIGLLSPNNDGTATGSALERLTRHRWRESLKFLKRCRTLLGLLDVPQDDSELGRCLLRSIFGCCTCFQRHPDAAS